MKPTTNLPNFSDRDQITYLSFGAGVQSTALLVLSNLGQLGCPKADVAIFSDTRLYWRLWRVKEGESQA